MRKWLMFILVFGAIALPFSVKAQNEIKLASIQVQLWPEYDQPSVLVIYDFQVANSTALPTNVNIRIPKDAKLVAVAQSGTNNNYVNVAYTGPTANGDWQTIGVQISELSKYHIEFYEPLTKNGTDRKFSYVWPADYEVTDFSVSLLEPTDVTKITTTPSMPESKGQDGATYLKNDFATIPLGQQFTLDIDYTKTTDTLSVSQQTVQPSAPLNSNTDGRVMLSNYWPYILGGLGLVLIIVGVFYFWRTSRGGRTRGRKHRAALPVESEEEESEIFCHQCGTRARPGNRFCRVCGTKLRIGE